MSARTFTPEEIEDFKLCMEFPLEFRKRIGVALDQQMLLAMHSNRFLLCHADEVTGPHYLLWRACFSQHSQSVILAPTDKRAVALLDMVTTTWKAMPDHLRPDKYEANKHHLVFENGSRIEAFCTSSDSTCGRSYSIVYMDNFAQVPWDVAEHFWEYIFPCIRFGQTKVIVNHGKTYFDKLWSEESQFVKL